jgi:hypothetical protein
MNINPAHMPIANLLGGTLTFQVPRFQRNYAWTAEETGALLKDLELCHAARQAGVKMRHHFFGGVVTARAPVQGSTRQNVEVIDGQQRLATFLMLAVQLARTMVRVAERLDPSTQHDLVKFLKERAQHLGSRYETYNDSISLRTVAVPRLQLSQPDQPFFEQLLAGASPQANRRSHRLLRQAFEDIGAYLADLTARAGDDSKRALDLDLVHEVFEQDWTVIHMAAEERADAYMLFQVLNDRGVGLTEGELLRACTLEALEPIASAAQMQAVEASWNLMLRGEAADVRDALGWIFASQIGVYPGKGTLMSEFQEEFFPMIIPGIPLTRDSMHTLLETISRLGADFSKIDLIRGGEWPCADSPGVLKWDADRLRLLVTHLRQSECIPLLIAATLLKSTQFSDVVQVLERFAFRYALVVEGPRSDAVIVFDKHAVAIRRDPGRYDPRTLKSDLRDLIQLHATDGVFAARLAELRYPRASSKKPLKYFLMTLEHYVRWFDEGAMGTPVCRDKLRVLDFENGTIEHVYAENSEQPDPQLEPLLDTLGNLTFLSPAENDAAGAKGFLNKKPFLAKSTSLLNQQIAQEADWTAAVVRKRQDRLRDIALKVFTV